MIYNYNEIAKKLKELRCKICRKPGETLSRGRGRIKNKYFDQGEMAEKISVSKGTYVGYENGNVGNMKLDTLKYISELCCVDIGYILGEYESRTLAISDVQDVTGLSETAISELSYRKTIYPNETAILSKLITNPQMWKSLSEIIDAKELITMENPELAKTTKILAAGQFINIIEKMIEGEEQ